MLLLSMSLCTEVEGLGGGAGLGVLRPPPGLIAPRLWCTAEQRDESVKTMSLPSSPSRAPGQAWIFPKGTIRRGGLLHWQPHKK